MADMNVSEEEMELLTGCKRLEDGIAALTRHATTPVLVTPKDAYCLAGVNSGLMGTYGLRGHAVDTTGGAGDDFGVPYSGG